MKVIDVNNPEQILEAKRILDDSQDLQSFINSLGMHNNIFIKNQCNYIFSLGVNNLLSAPSFFFLLFLACSQ